MSRRPLLELGALRRQLGRTQLAKHLEERQEALRVIGLAGGRHERLGHRLALRGLARLNRLQEPQKCQLRGAINPTLPKPPGNEQSLAGPGESTAGPKESSPTLLTTFTISSTGMNSDS